MGRQHSHMRKRNQANSRELANDEIEESQGEGQNCEPPPQTPAKIESLDDVVQVKADLVKTPPSDNRQSKSKYPIQSSGTSGERNKRRKKHQGQERKVYGKKKKLLSSLDTPKDAYTIRRKSISHDKKSTNTSRSDDQTKAKGSKSASLGNILQGHSTSGFQKKNKREDDWTSSSTGDKSSRFTRSVISKQERGSNSHINHVSSDDDSCMVPKSISSSKKRSELSEPTTLKPEAIILVTQEKDVFYVIRSKDKLENRCNTPNPVAIIRADATMILHLDWSQRKRVENVAEFSVSVKDIESLENQEDLSQYSRGHLPCEGIRHNSRTTWCVFHMKGTYPVKIPGTKFGEIQVKTIGVVADKEGLENWGCAVLADTSGNHKRDRKRYARRAVDAYYFAQDAYRMRGSMTSGLIRDHDIQDYNHGRDYLPKQLPKDWPRDSTRESRSNPQSEKEKKSHMSNWTKSSLGTTFSRDSSSSSSKRSSHYGLKNVESLSPDSRDADSDNDIPLRRRTRSKAKETREFDFKESEYGETYFVYPLKGGKDHITVTKGDIMRTEECVYLNDILIDFYIRYLLLERWNKEVTLQLADSVYVYSSLFVKRMFDVSKRTRKRFRSGSADSDLSNRTSAKAKTSEALYDWTRRWGRKVDLFQKEILIFPINDALHWSVVVVLNAHQIPAFVFHEQKCQLEKHQQQKSAATPVSKEGGEQDNEPPSRATPTNCGNTSTPIPAVEKGDQDSGNYLISPSAIEESVGSKYETAKVAEKSAEVASPASALKGTANQVSNAEDACYESKVSQDLETFEQKNNDDLQNEHKEVSANSADKSATELKRALNDPISDDESSDDNASYKSCEEVSDNGIVEEEASAKTRQREESSTLEGDDIVILTKSSPRKNSSGSLTSKANGVIEIDQHENMAEDFAEADRECINVSRRHCYSKTASDTAKVESQFSSSDSDDSSENESDGEAKVKTVRPTKPSQSRSTSRHMKSSSKINFLEPGPATTESPRNRKKFKNPSKAFAEDIEAVLKNDNTTLSARNSPIEGGGFGDKLSGSGHSSDGDSEDEGLGRSHSLEKTCASTREESQRKRSKEDHASEDQNLGRSEATSADSTRPLGERSFFSSSTVSSSSGSSSSPGLLKDDKSDEKNDLSMPSSPAPSAPPILFAPFAKYDPERSPQILFMDSIGSHRREKVANVIITYLQNLWKDRAPRTQGFEESPESIEVIADLFPDIKSKTLDVASQENSYDCGVYVVRYVQELLETKFNIANGEKPKSDDEIIRAVENLKDFSGVRKQMRDLVKKLHESYVENCEAQSTEEGEKEEEKAKDECATVNENLSKVNAEHEGGQGTKSNATKVSQDLEDKDEPRPTSSTGCSLAESSDALSPEVPGLSQSESQRGNIDDSPQDNSDNGEDSKSEDTDCEVIA